MILVSRGGKEREKGFEGGEREEGVERGSGSWRRGERDMKK